MNDLVKAILDFLEKVIPSALGAFGIGYSLGKEKTQKVQNELDKAKLDLEFEKNKESVLSDDSGKSAADILRSAIDEERRRGSGDAS
jgi:hypothetical protein